MRLTDLTRAEWFLVGLVAASVLRVFATIVWVGIERAYRRADARRLERQWVAEYERRPQPVMVVPDGGVVTMHHQVSAEQAAAFRAAWNAHVQPGRARARRRPMPTSAALTRRRRAFARAGR